MKIRILAFVLVICFISCRKSEIPLSKFVGTWHDTEYIIPGKSSIVIKKDSSFYYKSAGCDWRVVSKGNWKIIGDSIELNSTTSDTCYKMFPFVECIFYEENNRKDILTIPNCDPRNNASFAIFSKEKFYIKNDSLIYKLKSSSKCPDTLKIIFARTPKIKK
ncbi:hypothetical protein [Flavobacterium aquidurense]|uniref:Lipocalin-like domain-containing protein n=1 Tax=Flavobacterium aquidurense TaxID=362413 RepID=A0A0Q0W3Y5_9FLAO|nr:hypothetical protein [Flavobacterium aquidurense]KQB41330.1 hypothetical protein RC62_4076 [Flavobacterium aquidurense]